VAELLAKVGDVIQPGAALPGNVTEVDDRGSDTWKLGRKGWYCARYWDGPPETASGNNTSERISAAWGPLTVTAVREPEPAAVEVIATTTVGGAKVPIYAERKLIGPPHVHLDAPCTDACYEPAEPQPESDLLDLVRQLQHEAYRGGVADHAADERAGNGHDDEARALFARIEAEVQLLRAELELVTAQRDDADASVKRLKGEVKLFTDVFGAPPQQDGPRTLTLPEVPEGAVALVGVKSRRRYTPSGEPTPNGWIDHAAEMVITLAEVLDNEGSVTVEMAPPREPRTWPRLDAVPDDLRHVRGASGTVYARSSGTFAFNGYRGGQSVTRSLHALQEEDGPLTEVLDEPGGQQ
jgi:hypothetical protein